MAGFTLVELDDGERHYDYIPLDTHAALECIQGDGWIASRKRYMDTLAGSASGITSERHLAYSHRAYVRGYMFRDEARELWDLLNRTDLVCMTRAHTSGIPVAYDYIKRPAGRPQDAMEWPSIVPMSHALPIQWVPDKDVPDCVSAWKEHLVDVVCYDPRHGRLGRDYLCPTVLAALHAIRKRHD
jgi:hypothetical protein